VPPIPIYSPDEIDAIDRAAVALRAALDAGLVACRPGATTGEVDRVVAEALARQGAEPLFASVPDAAGHPYGFASCLSVNEQVIHAPPGDRVLQPGDLVTLDAGARLDGWCADAATSLIVADEANRRTATLLRTAGQAIEVVVAALAPARPWSDVAQDTRRWASEAGLRLVGAFGGHGIGRSLHEGPYAGFSPEHADPGSDSAFTLRPGMVLTIEPIVAEPGRSGVFEDAEPVTGADGWTETLADGAWACYEERMVAIAVDGFRPLGGW